MRDSDGRRFRRPGAGRGTILMEVVLALALFFVSGAIVFAGLSASFGAVDRLRMQAQAADLAVSLFSEIEMGEVEPVNDGPNAYEEESLADWTWQVVATPMELSSLAAPPMRQVEVIVRNKDGRTICRLRRLVEEPDEAGLSGGL